jgi:hypothetical protein
MHPKMMKRYLDNRFAKNPKAIDYARWLGEVQGKLGFQRALQNEIAVRQHHGHDMATVVTNLFFLLLAEKKFPGGLKELDEKDMETPEGKIVADLLKTLQFLYGFYDIKEEEELDVAIDSLKNIFGFTQEQVNQYYTGITQRSG